MWWRLQRANDSSDLSEVQGDSDRRGAETPGGSKCERSLWRQWRRTGEGWVVAVAEATMRPHFLRSFPLIILSMSAIYYTQPSNSCLSIFQIFIKILILTLNPTSSTFATSTPSFDPPLYLHSSQRLVVDSASLPRGPKPGTSVCPPYPVFQTLHNLPHLQNPVHLIRSQHEA